MQEGGQDRQNTSATPTAEWPAPCLPPAVNSLPPLPLKQLSLSFPLRMKVRLQLSGDPASMRFGHPSDPKCPQASHKLSSAALPTGGQALPGRFRITDSLRQDGGGSLQSSQAISTASISWCFPKPLGFAGNTEPCLLPSFLSHFILLSYPCRLSQQCLGTGEGLRWGPHQGQSILAQGRTHAMFALGPTVTSSPHSPK
jgi:hypothetical protein